ncbi:MAG: hypothetical protein HYS86_04080 [Candidatus Chisholmbacteria bacterium]|nr:hypothetical protein [Candidatus Chisholmbacteria bacterium]
MKFDLKHIFFFAKASIACSFLCVPKETNQRKGSRGFAVDPSASFGELRTTLFLGECCPSEIPAVAQGDLGQFLLSLSKKRMDLNRFRQRQFKSQENSRSYLPAGRQV